MRNVLAAAVVAALSASAFAQDKDRITLANGDVLTGTIKTMTDGKVTISTLLLGDITVPMANISNLVTQDQVALETKSGDLLKRRILGIEGGNLRMEGDTTSLALDNLGKINPPAKVEPKWDGSLKVSALWTDGNTDHRSVGAAFDASMRREIDRISFNVNWDYSDDKDPVTAQWKLSQRRAGAGLKYDYFLGKRLYLYVNSTVLGDTLADIQLRFTGGAGFGYTLIEDGTTTFVTEVGLSYVNENYRSATPSTDTVAVRCAYKLNHAFTKTTKLVHSVEAYPSTEDAGDIFLQGKLEVVTSLTDSMIASVGYVIDYDNTPAPGAERTDQRVLLSVGWSF